jgi:predicted DNA-binding transcriptional regulator AlpA
MNYQRQRNGKALADASPVRSTAAFRAIAEEQRAHVIDEPLLVTASQVTGLLAIASRTLWRRVSEGTVPAPVRIGGAVRWRLADIEHWVATGCPVPRKEDRKQFHVIYGGKRREG